MRNYGVDGFQNDPLKDPGHYGYYENGGTGILGAIDDLIGTVFFNDSDASGSIFGELTGYNAQQREFEQQEYLLEKQWEHDSYAAQMARAKAAGINPNLAAQGIVGGNVSAQPASVSSNTGGAAGAVNALSGVANAVTGGKASLAEAAFKDGTLQPTIDNLRNEALEHFANYGLTDAQRKSAENYLNYMDDDRAYDIEIKRVNVQRYKQEYKNAKVQHEQILSNIRLTDEQYNLIVAQEGEVKAREAKLQSEKDAIEEETRYQTWLNDWAISHNIRRDSNSFDAIYADLVINDGDAEGFCNDYVTYYGKKKKAEADAEQQAIELHSYNIARNTGLGKGFAEWFSRPNSVASAVADLGRRLSLLLKDGKIKRSEALEQLENEKSFNTSFEAFRDDLRGKRDSAWKKFCDGRFNTNISQEQYEHLYDDYKSYKDALEGLTKEDYSNMLLNQY